MIFVIAIIFLFSLSFSFAAQENATDVVADNSQADNIQTDDVLTANDNAEEISLENSDPEPLEAPVSANQTIKNGKVTNRYSNGVIYSANFYDAYGNPLKNTKVSCGVNSLSWGFEVSTDSNGLAKFQMALSKGTYKLYLINYNTGEVVNDTIKVFDVVTGGKDINMYYDGGNTYKVRVFDNNGNPVKAGQKVTFAVGNKKYTKKTDKNGYAKLKITSKPGLYEIGAKYKDFAISNSVMIKNVLKPLTSFKNRVVKPTITFKVKFLGKNKKNKKIKVKFNKKTYNAKTNKKGIAVFKLKTPKKVGVYKLVTSYKKEKITLKYSKYYG